MNVAVFDTAFHATIPAKNHLYPVPEKWRKELGVRKYGFHGISYAYVVERMARLLGEKPTAVVCHLGSGSSIAVVQDGESFDTSMGMTPLAGIMMGKRSGDIDPAVVSGVARMLDMHPDKVEKALNNDSGVSAIAGVADMRELAEKCAAGDESALLAADMWTDRIASFVVRYHNAVGAKAKTLVFTAGIGENSAHWVKEIVAKIKIADLKLDEKKLSERYDDAQLISAPGSEWAIYRVRTNEELVIARDVQRTLAKNQAK